MTEFQRMIYMMEEGYRTIIAVKVRPDGTLMSNTEIAAFRQVLESWQALPHPPKALSDRETTRAISACSYNAFR